MSFVSRISERVLVVPWKSLGTGYNYLFRFVVPSSLIPGEEVIRGTVGLGHSERARTPLTRPIK